MTDTRCTIEQISPLTEHVQKVVLKTPQTMDFNYGQYIRIVMGPDDRRAFSIANAPGTDTLELHIGATPDNPYSWAVMEKIRTSESLDIDGPHGEACLNIHKSMPTIVLAGGTGFSYAHCILQGLLEHNGNQPVFLYWGVRTEADLYAAEQLHKLSAQIKHFTFIPVVEHAEAGWQGRQGRVHEAVLQDFISLEPYQVFVAGRFEMAGVAREDFHNQGLQLKNLYGDAYAFI